MIQASTMLLGAGVISIGLIDRPQPSTPQRGLQESSSMSVLLIQLYITRFSP